MKTGAEKNAPKEYLKPHSVLKVSLSNIMTLGRILRVKKSSQDHSFKSSNTANFLQAPVILAAISTKNRQEPMNYQS